MRAAGDICPVPWLRAFPRELLDAGPLPDTAFPLRMFPAAASDRGLLLRALLWGKTANVSASGSWSIAKGDDPFPIPPEPLSRTFSDSETIDWQTGTAKTFPGGVASVARGTPPAHVREMLGTLPGSYRHNETGYSYNDEGKAEEDGWFEWRFTMHGGTRSSGDNIRHLATPPSPPLFPEFQIEVLHGGWGDDLLAVSFRSGTGHTASGSMLVSVFGQPLLTVPLFRREHDSGPGIGVKSFSLGSLAIDITAIF